jgi:hypothetical protein
MFHIPAHKSTTASQIAIKPPCGYRPEDLGSRTHQRAAARFSLAAPRLRGMVEDMNRRTGGNAEVSISGGNEFAEARGDRQDVMFVIGEVAAQGEDCLVGVDVY